MDVFSLTLQLYMKKLMKEVNQGLVKLMQNEACVGNHPVLLLWS